MNGGNQRTSGMRGSVACGHPQTAAAAMQMLDAGGNAFDAALAGLCAAFSAEPVLASLGGGGFLLAAPAGAPPQIYDFFCQTPGHRPAAGEALDFYPIGADFGTTVQEFHIGRASVAVPGVPAGIFAVHEDLCSLSLAQIFAPAIRLARDGVILNPFQAEVFRIVAPIYRATASARANYRPDDGGDRLPGEGERLRFPALADALERLAEEGVSLFYAGEYAAQILQQCGAGGLLAADDLSGYRVLRREPLRAVYRGTELLTNPLPSSGGVLIRFALQALQQLQEEEPEADAHALLARVMAVTNLARRDFGLEDPHHGDAMRLLDEAAVAAFMESVRTRVLCPRGTTHISVVDAAGNEASLSVSNGEGCGEMLGDTGIMLNNMLGEEDLNPRGFHAWTPGQRITSMMAPSLLVFPDGRRIALGSGGSNRIRTAILQVIVNLVDRGMSLQQAVEAPRLHVENQLLSLEPGFSAATLDALREEWPDRHAWQTQSLFFGGVHAVSSSPAGMQAAGDPRRSGVARSG